MIIHEIAKDVRIPVIGEHCVIGNNVSFGNNVTIRHNCIIGDNVILGDNVYIDSNTIIRNNVTLGSNLFLGANCIIGEHLMDFCIECQNGSVNNQCVHSVVIGKHSIIRSGTIIYGGCIIGDYFQTGHRATIRENTIMGHHVRVGTLTDVQFECRIGNYVSMHSNIFLGERTEIDDYVWIFPGVTVTNDPMPPSNILRPVHIKSFASIAARAVLLPGVVIGQNALVAAGSIVTRNVGEREVVAGNPAKKVKMVEEMYDKVTGQYLYPWPEHFKRGMPWEESDFSTWKDSWSGTSEK